MARFSSPNLQPFRFSKTTLGTTTKASFKIPVINALTAWEGPDLHCPFPSPVPAFDGGLSNFFIAPQRTSSSRPRNLPGVVLYSSLFRTVIVPASQDGNNYHSGLTGPRRPGCVSMMVKGLQPAGWLALGPFGWLWRWMVLDLNLHSG